MGEAQQKFVMSLVAYAVQRGVPANELCRRSRIDLELLRQGSAALSDGQLNDLWLNASELCGDPLFGLHFGESLQLAALGVVGEIVKSSRTVGEAIGFAASLSRAVSDLFAMEVRKAKKSFTMHLTVAAKGGSPFVERQMADLLMVFTIHELNGFLLERIQPVSVRYPYKIEYPEEYERVFRCANIEKGRGYCIEFSSEYWDEPIISADYELQQHLIEKLNARRGDRLVSQKLLKTKVSDYLIQNAYLGVLSLADVAANFNLTTRSLQRRLQEEGTSFQDLTDSVRKSLALHFLSSGKYQIKEISIMLGYNELSAFSRAFKRWTGSSPQAFAGRKAG